MSFGSGVLRNWQEGAVNQRAPKSVEGKNLAPRDGHRSETRNGEFE